MIKTIWKYIRRLTVFVGIVFSMFAFMEIVRFYEFLCGINKYVGYSFVVIMVFIVIVLIIHSLKMFFSFPKMLNFPKIKDSDEITRRDMKKYCKYLMLYMKRLCNNNYISEDDIKQLHAGQDKLQKFVNNIGTDIKIRELIEIENNYIRPLLVKISKHADREIEKCVRDVMIGVTLSPYRAADLLIVLYKNIRMVLKIIRIYNNRPGIKEQIFVANNIIEVVAVVNILNFGSKIIESLASNIKFVGRFIDDIAQGIGAGLLTSITGHSALMICSNYDGREIRQDIRGKIKLYYKDIKGIVKTDILTKLKLVPKKKPKELEQQEEIEQEILKSLDEAGGHIEDFVKPPIKKGSVFTRTGRGIKKGLLLVSKDFKRGSKASGRAIEELQTKSKNTIKRRKQLVKHSIGTSISSVIGFTSGFRSAFKRRKNKKQSTDKTEENKQKKK